MTSPCLQLNNGAKLPILGLGTYASQPGEVTQAVKDAIDAGYRHFDCAHLYGNEVEVGAGIRAKIADGTVKREELFVTSKIWNTFHPYEMVVPMCKTTLEHLGLDYVDLYLIHWPFAWKEGNNLWPMENGKMLFSDVDYLDTWRGMEECQKLGLTKSIGLSNFNSEQIQRILDHATIKPVNNQVEANPYINQKKLIQFCREHDITVTGYCPLVRAAGPKNLLANPDILKMAQTYNKTPAQIVLKYLVQLGISVIPKTVTKSRMIENISIFDFELNEEDLKTLDAMNNNSRVCGFEENKTHKYFPFNIEY